MNEIQSYVYEYGDSNDCGACNICGCGRLRQDLSEGEALLYVDPCQACAQLLSLETANPQEDYPCYWCSLHGKGVNYLCIDIRPVKYLYCHDDSCADIARALAADLVEFSRKYSAFIKPIPDETKEHYKQFEERSWY